MKSIFFFTLLLKTLSGVPRSTAVLSGGSDYWLSDRVVENGDAS
ncbi:hypothetical protein WNY78_00740 [Psychroserpens sp. AS72]